MMPDKARVFIAAIEHETYRLNHIKCTRSPPLPSLHFTPLHFHRLQI